MSTTTTIDGLAELVGHALGSSECSPCPRCLSPVHVRQVPSCCLMVPALPKGQGQGSVQLLQHFRLFFSKCRLFQE